jgi:arylsulfatase A-like enzyme
MDKQVGELLSKLKSDGLLDNTIVIWTTDHGDGLPRAKREIYDSGIKVPLILHWPASLRLYPAAAGSVDARLVSFVDFAPSVLSWAGVAIPGFIQGRPTLSDPAEERAFIYAAKDRLDEFPFRERAVRDGRFKYIFNYQPGRPGAQHIAYRDQMDMMAELWASYGAGKMSDEQKFWFDPRPQEELYDLQVDPHEVHNLADNPQYKGQLERMRKALAVWRERVKDHSDQPEAEMALEFWPDGKQPLTAPPTISLDGNRVTLACDSTGASIGYRIGKNSWQVYSGPFEWPTGLRLEAKAVRYGWQESEVAVLLPDATNEGN